MSGRSWNYVARLYSDEERVRAAGPSVWVTRAKTAGPESMDHGLARYWPYVTTCSNHNRRRGVGCGPAIGQAEWDYITGRAGRVSTMRRQLCADCFERFLMQHPEIPIPKRA